MKLVSLFALALALAAAPALAASDPATVQRASTPSPGVEPDEIDARQEEAAPRARAATATPAKPARATPARAPATRPSTVPTPGKFVAAKGDDGAQAYETADCSTPEKKITCCTQGSGDGASCNLFILLCNEGGGTGKGDGGDAICVE